MAGILAGLSDQDVWRMVMMQQALMDGGLTRIGAYDWGLPPLNYQGGPDLVMPPGVQLQNEPPPPMPERNPKRKKVEDELLNADAESQMIEQAIKAGHTAPMYGA